MLGALAMTVFGALAWNCWLAHTPAAAAFKAYADTKRGLDGVLFGLLIFLWIGVAMLSVVSVADLV